AVAWTSSGLDSTKRTAYDPPVASADGVTITLTLPVPWAGTLKVGGTKVTQLAAECGSVPGVPNAFRFVVGSYQRSMTLPRIATGVSLSFETFKSNCSTCCGLNVARISAGVSPSDCAAAGFTNASVSNTPAIDARVMAP